MDMGVTSHYHAGVSLAETSYLHYCVPGVVVNGNGDRFVDETISYIVALRKFKEEPTTDFYWIFDEPASYGLAARRQQVPHRLLVPARHRRHHPRRELPEPAEKAGLPNLVAALDTVNDCALSGAARENHAAYPTVVRNHNGTPFLPNQLLERHLSRLPLKEFPCEDAVSICDAMRRLVGWEEIRYELEKYIEKQVQERYFLVGEREDGFTVFRPARCGRNCARRMWMKDCCTLPAMWRSAIQYMGRVLNLSRPGIFSVWFPSSARTW